MLEDAQRLFAIGTDYYWIDIGTPAKYLQAHTDVLHGEVGLPPLRNASEVSPGVWAEADFELAPDATVLAPALLGADSIVEGGARVENATLGRGSHVERDAVVHDAVLLDGAHVCSRARIEHSIVGPSATVGCDAGVLACSVVGPGAQIGEGVSVEAERVEQPAAAG
jgi:NDP-sugar pyrophosphorylase family protein